MKAILIFSILAFIIGISSGLFFLEDKNDAASPLAKMSIGGDFTLYAGDDEIHLSDFEGKVVLIFFGYTSCPDICPTTLASISSALKKLTESELNNVQVLFVSVDPERDTPEKIRRFTNYFHADIIGISGSKQDIDEVVSQYASAYRKIVTDSAIGYLVEHSSALYLVNPKGELVNVLPGDADVEIVVQTVRKLM